MGKTNRKIDANTRLHMESTSQFRKDVTGEFNHSFVASSDYIHCNECGQKRFHYTHKVYQFTFKTNKN